MAPDLIGFERLGQRVCAPEAARIVLQVQRGERRAERELLGNDFDARTADV